MDQDCDRRDGTDADGDGYWTSTGDCDDTRADVNPAAFDADPTRDRDCDGVVDVIQPLVARSCATGAGAPLGWLALLPLLVSTRRRR